jgi:hypothetical protein
MAQEVPPFDRLPPDSQQWGRWATGRIQSLQDSSASALSNLQAQNQSLAAQLNRLQLQVADLSERKTLFASAGVNDFLFFGSPTSTTNLTVISGMAFSIQKKRQVSVTAITSYLSQLGITSPQTIQGFSSVVFAVEQNGISTLLNGSASAYSGHTNSASGTIQTRMGGSVVASASSPLDPGDYTVRVYISGSVTASGGTSTVSHTVGGNGTTVTVNIGDVLS